MALRNILTDGNPTLSKVCRPVTSFDERLATLIDDMKQTVVHANGVGLAAPQVGVLRRVVVVDLGDEIVELVNPRILEQEGEQDGLGMKPRARITRLKLEMSTGISKRCGK